LSGGESLLTTLNKYRAAYGLPPFTWSKTLQANAFRTGADGGGVNQVHQLDVGNGQVITPGTDVQRPDLKGETPFSVAMLSWLCEVRSDPQVSGKCGIVDSVMNMQYSTTGHHDILVDPKYKTCGCDFASNPNAAPDSPYQGLWTCTVGLGGEP
jgi:hypothetical protein